MKQIIIKQTLILFLCVIHLSGFAQKTAPENRKENKNKLIQFTGIVVEGDSLRPVPYVSILVRNSNKGTVSDYFGYFSFVAQLRDTIEFSAIGYTSASYTIPDTLSINKYSLIQVLRTDTIQLRIAEVYPWPTKEEFKQAFLNLDLPDDAMQKAQRNMQAHTYLDRLEQD